MCYSCNFYDGEQSHSKMHVILHACVIPMKNKSVFLDCQYRILWRFLALLRLQKNHFSGVADHKSSSPFPFPSSLSPPPPPPTCFRTFRLRNDIGPFPPWSYVERFPAILKLNTLTTPTRLHTFITQSFSVFGNISKIVKFHTDSEFKLRFRIFHL
jgi:hypothetical protein